LLLPFAALEACTLPSTGRHSTAHHTIEPCTGRQSSTERFVCNLTAAAGAALHEGWL
jgi:hypothetical protein